jgi:N-acetylneuraminate lyase
MTTPFDFIAAAHTPLDAHGELNLQAVAPLAEHLRSVGATGVLVAGSTGEGHSLTSDERRRLAERWVEVGGDLQVMIQVGHSSVPEAIELARHAAEIGADATCAAPPNWFKITTAEQLAETLAAIAGASPELPFYYYHIPVLSGVHVKMAALLEVVRGKIPNFAGIKFTHDDLDDFGESVQKHGDGVRMMWGIDEALVSGLGKGACGAVGSTYNFVLPIYKKLIRAFEAGDMETANAMQARSLQLVELLNVRGYGPSAKAVMGLLGIECGPARLPLIALGAEAPAELRSELERLGYFEWINR